MNSWLESLRIYREPRMLAVLFMGFSSGLPFPLTFATLSYWLAEAGVSRTQIGLFVLVGLSYSYKFLWSPFVDRLPFPVLTRRLGRRRGWLLAIQTALMASILALGWNDPSAQLATTAALAVLVAFLSATQDIVIDAYRIELLKPTEQGPGAAATQWGYRFGLLASGAGALYAAHFGGWAFSYAVMAGLMIVGMITVLLTPEPAESAKALEPMPGNTALERTVAWFRRAAIDPFVDFMKRPGWLAILVFVVLYKLADALIGNMANPFYVSLGFTKIEVANITKLFGFIATLAGVALGGLIVRRIGFYRSLLIGGILHGASNLMFAVQAMAGHDLGMLTLTIFVDHFTGGLSAAALVGYLSSLCNVAFTATQYALLSSLAALPSKLMSSPAGWLADRMDWVSFFVAMTLAAVPGILMVLWLMRKFPLRLPVAQPALAGND